MSERIVSPVTKAFEIELLDRTDQDDLPLSLQQQVESVWDERLANHPILSFIGLHGDVLIAKTVEYKRFHAVQMLPELRIQLGCTPVAVTGICVSGSHILIGKRAKNVSQYPGFFEFAPTGSLDAKNISDFRKQLTQELQEETGVESIKVSKIAPYAVIHDLGDGVVDICATISLHPSCWQEELKDTPEYNELFWIHRDACSAFIQAHIDAFVPSSITAFQTFLGSTPETG